MLRIKIEGHQGTWINSAWHLFTLPQFSMNCYPRLPIIREESSKFSAIEVNLNKQLKRIGGAVRWIWDQKEKFWVGFRNIWFEVKVRENGNLVADRLLMIDTLTISINDLDAILKIAEDILSTAKSSLERIMGERSKLKKRLILWCLPQINMIPS